MRYTGAEWMNQWMNESGMSEWLRSTYGWGYGEDCNGDQTIGNGDHKYFQIKCLFAEKKNALIWSICM